TEATQDRVGPRDWHRELKMTTLTAAAPGAARVCATGARVYKAGVTSTRLRNSGMPQPADWKVRSSVQPKPQDYTYDLDRALSAVVAVHTIVPADAFSAETLGTERAGNGVLIADNGVVLTIGYLITEAEQVWLTFSDGRVAPGHVQGYDQETGFGLVQTLGHIDLPALSLGQSGSATAGESVVVAGAGGRHHSVAAHIAARQEFAGYWEYVLDEAIFTAPAHPNWGGTAVIGPKGDLIGIGSLQLEQPREN